MSEWPITAAAALAALAMGALGGPHCVGMCGGLAGALVPPAQGEARAGAGTRVRLLVGLACGRVGSYAALGALVGVLGASVVHALGSPAAAAGRVALGVVLVLMGLSIGGFWPGALRFLEAPAAKLWARVAPLARRAIPVRTPARAVAAGALWGLLPCGLVYAALAAAAVHASPSAGALWMAAFGLGTVPAVWLSGWLGAGLHGWLARRSVRGAAGTLLVVAGLWTSLAPIAMQALGGHGPGHAGGAAERAVDGSVATPHDPLHHARTRS